MKNLWKIFMGCYAAGFCMMAQAQEQGLCDASGCVVFEVTVKLDSHVDVPVKTTAGHSSQVAGENASFETVVTRAGDTCTKQVKVPQPIYASITIVLASMGSATSEPTPILTPTQQSLLLFYSTLMQQTLGFQCTPRDIYPEQNGAGSSVPSSSSPNAPASGYLAAYNGFAQMYDKIIVFISENGVQHRFEVGDIVFGDWIIDSVDTAKRNSLVLKNGLERRYILSGEMITL